MTASATGPDGSVYVSEGSVSFFDEHRVYRSLERKHIKWMRWQNRYWVAHPMSKGGPGVLQEIIAMTDQYILMLYYNRFDYLYIYDYDGNVLNKKIGYSGSDDYKTKKEISQKLLIEIAPYFNVCAPLMRKFQQNVDDEKKLTDGIAAYVCDGAPDIDRYINKFADRDIKSNE
jgi:hypothetical protein